MAKTKEIQREVEGFDVGTKLLNTLPEIRLLQKNSKACDNDPDNTEYVAEAFSGAYYCAAQKKVIGAKFDCIALHSVPCYIQEQPGKNYLFFGFRTPQWAYDHSEKRPAFGNWEMKNGNILKPVHRFLLHLINPEEPELNDAGLYVYSMFGSAALKVAEALKDSFSALLPEVKPWEVGLHFATVLKGNYRNPTAEVKGKITLDGTSEYRKKHLTMLSFSDPSPEDEKEPSKF